MIFCILRIFPLFGLVCTLFLCSCSLVTALDKKERPARVYFLNVGQGDACLLRTPVNRYLLFDLGNHDGFIIPFLKSVGVDTLDAIFISHPDLDHYGSFLAVLKTFPVKKVYLPVGTSPNPQWLAVINALDEFQGQKETLLAGDTLLFSDGIGIHVLWPFFRTDFKGNNLSQVLRVEYANQALLLTGDIENEGEMGLLAGGQRLDAQLLKVAHHGSRTSNGLPFLSAVSPRWAIISCDSSVYGHPHPEAVADLNYIIGDSTHVLRTDRLGSLVFDITSQGVQQVTERFDL